MDSLFYIKFKTSILLVCLLGMIHCMATSSQGGNETDKMSLLNFKAGITDDPLRIMQSWNDSAHFCNWLGVFCGRRHQRVVELDLSSLKLSGSISPHIGNLSFLRTFYIYNNSLSGEIPSEITHLRRLQKLSLSNNSIGGQIPSNISACSNLRLLYIAYNQLVGKIPSAFSSLSKLQYLNVRNNNLTGSIPSSFGNLSSLDALALSENHIGGSIPYALGRLTGVKYLYLADNRFSGNLPPSLFNLSSIRAFDVGGNEIEGRLPSIMGITTLLTLEFLSFASNKFTGSIPISISNASNLEYLLFVKNRFTGEVPSMENLIRLEFFNLAYNQLGSARINDLSFLCTLTNATNLIFLPLNVNNFAGTLPGCIGNLSTTLRVLALDNNDISGIVPAGIGALVNLNGLSLSYNRLSGHLPSVISKLQKLQKLYLGANKFTGEIPHSISNLTLLIELTLGDNNFHGTIPSSLGKCQNLLWLDLSNNNLTGNIPLEIFGLSSLSIRLDLSKNSLIGALPSAIGNLKNLGELLVGHNLLSGEIPSSLGSCVRLEVLNMQRNSFQGSIPSSLSALRGLQVLDLSQNNLSCQIPKFLGSFAFLLSLNLSFNNFEGLVPSEGVFKNGSATSVMGNIKLCGGIQDFHLPACDFKRSANTRSTRKTRIIIVAVAGLLGAVFLLSFLFLLRLRRKTQANQLSSENSLSRISYQNLYDATNGFSASNLVSVGSFGSVYKGALRGGSLIAVKVLNLRDRRAAKSFVDECEALRNIRHRNLVKVLTACSSIDHEGNDFKAIVYEFMVNGSLEEWLHPIVEVDGNNEAPKKLNLLRRLNVAIDIASALEYLHHHCETTIVHCDMKPSNVLLDDELTGHVSDFGIAKFIVKDMNNSPNNHSSSVGLRGTIGYAPPEYGVGEQVSTSGDVYSYGILLLEIFTGKRPTNDMFKDDWNLHKFAESALPDRVTEILDPILLQEMEEIHTRRNNNRIRKNIVMEGLNLIVGIGVACSAELSGERMNISDVTSKLCSVRNKLLHSESRKGRVQS